MSLPTGQRTLSWDWYPGRIPENVRLEADAYLETTYSFVLHRSRVRDAVSIGHAATIYMGTMFDVGPKGRVHVGRFALVHGAWIMCDAVIEIGDYSLISWNVVLMDSYRLPRDLIARRHALEQIPNHPLRCSDAPVEALPIHIGRNVWIGFDSCVLPGVSIGEGAIVGARSVVMESVPPYTIVAGNPARVIREIENDESGPAQPPDMP